MNDFEISRRIIGIVAIAVKNYNYLGLKKESILKIFNATYGKKCGLIIDAPYFDRFYNQAGADYLRNVRELFVLRNPGNIQNKRLEESLKELNELTNGCLDDFFKKEDRFK